MNTKVVHCKKNRYDVYIGRPGPLGNPYEIGPDGTREEVIQKFEKYARRLMNEDLAFRKAIQNCEGKTLGCWCAPKACHGHVIIKLIEELKEHG